MREIRESVTGTDADAVCLSVAGAVARAVGTDPSRLEPLAGVVDPDVLERLVADEGPNGGAVMFTMAGCDVEVDAGGDITVTCPDAPAAPGTVTDRRREEASAHEPAGATGDAPRADGGVDAAPAPAPDADERSRYEFTEFTDELGTVAVLYDTRNPHAWIQSTSPAAVER